MTSSLEIVEGCLDHSGIQTLLREHLLQMHSHSPPGSVHALPFEGLADARVTFWGAFSGKSVAGCGALKELDVGHGEIKSMRTAATFQRSGVATQILNHLVDAAVRRGYTRLSLETGSGPPFTAAHQLYIKHGFEFCEPFSSYTETAFSRFMCKDLRA
ncbi:MAG: GNAT family N-acetyltransferase [Oceanococcus sp.]